VHEAVRHRSVVSLGTIRFGLSTRCFLDES
jgi:hypothetical protein